jgi:hypothetical protein
MYKQHSKGIASLIVTLLLLLIPELNSCQTAQDTRQKTQDKTQTLSAEKTQQIKKILSGYDASKLTADDARAIQNKFREAGIHAGPEINGVIIEAGFDPEKLKELAPPPDAGNKDRQVPPSIDERIRIIDEKICTPLSLSAIQKETVEKAFRDFYTEMDALAKSSPQAGLPLDKSKVEPLEKSRDEKIKKVLSTQQYPKYMELEKTTRPDRKKEKGSK